MKEGFVYTYTRARALNDGVLVDVSKMANEAGFKHPVAITAGVQAILKAVTDHGAQDYDGRLWDMLSIFLNEARKVRGDTIFFSVNFLMTDGKLHEIEFWAKCGPGDNPKPVITVMLKNED
jgi:hypothetical protein